MSRPTYAPAKKKLFDAWRALGEHLAITEWRSLNGRRADLIAADELSEPEKAEFRALQRLADMRTDLLDPFEDLVSERAPSSGRDDRMDTRSAVYPPAKLD